MWSLIEQQITILNKVNLFVWVSKKDLFSATTTWGHKLIM